MAKRIDSLSLLRMRLKYQVFNSRRDFFGPICPICGESLIAPSMHEAFIPRGVVRGCSEQVQLLIYVPENVVLIHEGECHIFAQHHEEGKIKCAMQIIKYEGYENILKWMKQIDSVLLTVDNQKYTILEKANERLSKKS